LYSSVNALRVDPIVGSFQDQEPAKHVPPSTKPGTVQYVQAVPELLALAAHRVDTTTTTE